MHKGSQLSTAMVHLNMLSSPNQWRRGARWPIDFGSSSLFIVNSNGLKAQYIFYKCVIIIIIGEIINVIKIKM